MVTAPNTTELSWVVVTSNEYSLPSVPPEHAPSTPFELPATSAATGFADATPEYRATTINAFVAAEARVAMTVPVVAAPWAHQSSMPV
jgi:hypothetical protein